jgi:hypothetical protein
VGAAWTSYTPVWTAVTTDPAIGNGTIQGKFCQVNKLVVARINIIFGSTTTFGSGNFLFNYPVTANGPLGNNERLLSSGQYLDSSTGNSYFAIARYNSSSTTDFLVQVFSNASQAVQLMSPTVPFTAANNDAMQLNFCYEVA